MGSLLRLFRYFGAYKWYLLGAILCSILVSSSSVTFPLLIGLLAGVIIGHSIVDSMGDFIASFPPALVELINRTIGKWSTALSSDYNLLIILGLFLTLVFAFSSYGQIYLTSLVGEGAIFRLRNQVFEHLLRLSSRYFGERRSGEVTSRLTNDISVLHHFISDSKSLLVLVRDPLTLVGSLFIVFYLNWRLSIITLVVGGLVVAIISKFGRRMQRASRRAQGGIAETTSILQETISGIDIVKTFNMEEDRVEEFSQKNLNYYRLFMRGVRLAAAQVPFVEFLTVLPLLGILWYVQFELTSGGMNMSKLLAFVFQLSYISNSVRNISATNLLIQQSAAAVGRVFEIVDAEVEVKEIANARHLPSLKGEMRFDRVGFSYDDGTRVLKDIELTVKSGESVAIVGPSGTGKTTLVNLIPRLYDPTTGVIYLDEYDVKSVSLRSLRGQIGIVSQDTILFSGTVGENISWGKAGANKEEVEEAARAANAHDFIMRLPQGYDTQIGERGFKLSGGERQRLTIARAIIRKPAILILDEATSNLDSESERLIQEALSKLMKAQTTIVIAHRLSTVVSADRIVVLEDGKITQIGTHNQLYAEEGLYRKLYELQFAETSADLSIETKSKWQ